jgi:peptidoglycan L-alanyl-D-glutamate endopeptidase CwlK
MIEDKITIQRLAKLHPLLRVEALLIYREVLAVGVQIRITCTMRSFAEQDELYKQGRSKPGPVATQVKGGYSYHNYGLAVDFCLLLKEGKEISYDRILDSDHDKEADWQEVVAVFKKYGWEWGGDWLKFKDYPHFQKTTGLKVDTLLKMYNSNQLENGYPIINS